MRQSPLYKALIWGLLFLSLFLLFKLTPILVKPAYIPVDDFVRHWAAGRLLISGGNPYSSAEIQVFQDQASGAAAKSEVITPNYIPPWTMPLLAIFGLMDYPISRLAWLVINVAVLLICSELLWKLYGGLSKHKWIAWIVCFSFGPTISVLGKGQTSCLVLLGIAGFLYFTEMKPNGWVAGAFAALITIKPQVLYLFWPFFLFWLIKNRKWSAFLGLCAAIFISSVITLLFDRQIFGEYINALKYNPPSMFATPTIGGYLRYFLYGGDRFWLQFVPVVLGLIWGAVYLWRHHSTWLWTNDLPLLILISIITSSYSWTYDQVVLVVPVVQAWVWLILSDGRRKYTLFILSHFVLSFLDSILHRYYDDFWFIWFAPATLVWYLAVKQQVKQNEQPI